MADPAFLLALADAPRPGAVAAVRAAESVGIEGGVVVVEVVRALVVLAVLLLLVVLLIP